MTKPPNIEPFSHKNFSQVKFLRKDNGQMMELNVDEIESWWNDTLMKLQIVELPSWWNFSFAKIKLSKLHVKLMTCWKSWSYLNVMLMKWETNKIPNWWNSILNECLVHEEAFLLIFKVEDLASCNYNMKI